MTKAEYDRRHAAAGTAAGSVSDQWLYEHSVNAPDRPRVHADLDDGEESITVGVELSEVGPIESWVPPFWWVVMWRPDVPNSRFIDLVWQRVEGGVGDQIPIHGDAGWYFVGGTDNSGRWVTAKSAPFQIEFPAQP